MRSELRPFWLWSLVTLMVLALCLPAIADDDDGNEDHGLVPYGPRGTPLPPGATLIDMTQFQLLLNRGVLHITTLHQPARQNRRFAEQDRLYERKIKDYLGDHPELTGLARLLANDPANGDGIQARGDGTWSVQLPGSELPIVTLGRSSKLGSIFHAIQFSQDPGANFSLYASLYNHLPPGYLDGLDVPPIPPAQLRDASLAAIQQALGSLGSDWQNIITHVRVPFPIELQGCDGEVGASLHHDLYGDRSGNRDYCTPSSAGIYANFDFPNKSYNTCVKDQSGRGICHTFAVTSATELQIALNHNLKVNLSEQDLMEHYRLLWQPGIQHESGDGFELANDVINNNYFQPYEDRWDYNPAPSEFVQNGVYVNVCDFYVSTEPCSNTAPEAPEVCGSINGLFYCGFQDAGIPGSPYQLASVSRIWNPSDPELSTEMMILSLAFNNSVVMAFNVSPGFMSPPNGFVPYDAKDLAATSKGQHVVHIIGFISNDDLRQKLPDAPPASGAGYFIIKNSWSTCHGDGGYYYVPWDYVKAQAVDVFNINGVN